MGLLMGVQGSSFSVDNSNQQQQSEIPNDEKKLGFEFTAEEVKSMFEMLEKYQNSHWFVFFRDINGVEQIQDFLDSTKKKFDKTKFSHTSINKMIAKEKKEGSFHKLLEYIRRTTALIGEFVEDKDLLERIKKQNQEKEPTIEIYLEVFQLFEKMMKIQQSTYMLQLELLIGKLTKNSTLEQVPYTMFKSLFQETTPEEIKGLLQIYKKSALRTSFDMGKVFKQESTEEEQPIKISKTKTTLSKGGIDLVKQLLKCADIQGELKLTESTTEAQITAEDKALLDQLMEKVVPDLKTSKKVGSDSDNPKKLEEKPESWLEKNKKPLIIGTLGVAGATGVGALVYSQSNSQENNQNNQNNNNNE
jgi:hypothetical protein